MLLYESMSQNQKEKKKKKRKTVLFYFYSGWVAESQSEILFSGLLILLGKEKFLFNGCPWRQLKPRKSAAKFKRVNIPKSNIQQIICRNNTYYHHNYLLGFGRLGH